jgi:hypothetical protein
MHRVPQDKVRLAIWHESTVYVVVSVLTLSGIAWLICHYFLSQQGALGPLPNRYEGLWLKVHGAAAMLALFFIGSLLPSHMLRAWALQRNRISGGLMGFSCVLLAVTGCGLYYIGDEQLRAWTSLAHWLPGLLMPLLLLTHVLLGQTLKRRRSHRAKTPVRALIPPAVKDSSRKTSSVRSRPSTLH